MFGRISRLQNSETRTSIFKWEECPFGFHKECFFRIGRHLVRRSNIPTMSHYLKETIALTLGTLGAKKVPSKRPSSCPPSGEELPSKTLKMSAAPAPATSTSELKSTGSKKKQQRCSLCPWKKKDKKKKKCPHSVTSVNVSFVLNISVRFAKNVCNSMEPQGTFQFKLSFILYTAL